MNNGAEKFLNTLGMARRAGVLVVGQDNVFSDIRRHVPMIVITTGDCSASVMRSLLPHVERGEVRTIALEDIDRSAVGRHIGIGAAQIVALPLSSGFAKKILSLYDRSDTNE